MGVGEGVEEEGRKAMVRNQERKMREGNRNGEGNRKKEGRKSRRK